MNNNNYAVILAGGIGSRFWPVSTPEHPKQFQDMLGTGESLLQTTYNRLIKILPKEHILILTNNNYEDLVKKQLPSLQDWQIVLEPIMRNTAPSILLAALKIHKENPDATMIVAPSDHWIEDEEVFAQEVNSLLAACKQKDMLVTLGIKPSFPNTGYGYIQYDDKDKGEIKKVKNFSEKPSYEVAKKFLSHGNYLWNAGIFIWNVKTIIKAFEIHLPEMYELFSGGKDAYNTPGERDFIKANYHKAENTSIDYGIMEKAGAVYVQPAGFDWNDLGTWGSLYSKMGKDENCNAAINAELHSVNASGNIIYSPKPKKVVVEGLDNYIIVDEENVLLILPKEKEQEIKQLRDSVMGNG